MKDLRMALAPGFVFLGPKSNCRRVNRRVYSLFFHVNYRLFTRSLPKEAFVRRKALKIEQERAQSWGLSVELSPQDLSREKTHVLMLEQYRATGFSLV